VVCGQGWDTVLMMGFPATTLTLWAICMTTELAARIVCLLSLPPAELSSITSDRNRESLSVIVIVLSRRHFRSHSTYTKDRPAFFVKIPSPNNTIKVPNKLRLGDLTHCDFCLKYDVVVTTLK